MTHDLIDLLLESLPLHFECNMEGSLIPVADNPACRKLILEKRSHAEIFVRLSDIEQALNRLRLISR